VTYPPICILLVAVIAGTQPVAAQPAGAQAETLFRQGRDLMASGKIAGACAAFQASQKLEPAVTTLMNLGGCREKNGQLATAWGIFLDVQRNLREMTDEGSQQIVQVATTRAANLEPRLSKLTVNVPVGHQLAKLEVLRNDDVVEAGAWNSALPIDGGRYLITARAPGYESWTGTVVVDPEKDTKSIDVPLLKKAPPQKPPPKQAPTRFPLIPIAVGGGGALMLASALAFKLSGDTTYSQANAETANNATRMSLYNSANAKRYAAEALTIAGVATAGVAVWLYLRERRSEKEKHVSLSPSIAGGRAVVVLSGRY
jgi:hypothetical protein